MGFMPGSSCTSNKNKGDKHDKNTPSKSTMRRPCSSLRLPTKDDVKNVTILEINCSTATAF